MEHPFEYRAHFNAEGEPCHCPWGNPVGNEHFGSLKVVESSKLDWLIKRKGMDSPRNQKWLDYMMESGLAHDSTDKLLPWLHREFNKGRLLPGVYPTEFGVREPALHYTVHEKGMPTDSPVKVDPDGKPESVGNPVYGDRLNLSQLRELQENLTEMQKRKQGIDLMQHKVHELMPKVQDFRKWQGEQKRKKYGEVLHQFGNGWTMRRLQNDAEHRDEGDNMHHCVGQPQYGYADHTKYGTKIYGSLRDEMNQPHATIEITPDHWKHKDTGEEHHGHGPPGSTEEGWIPQIGPRSEVDQFFGKHDSPVEEEHQRMVDQWLGEHEAPLTEEQEPQDAEYLNVQPAYDLESYNAIHGDEGNYMEYADETDDQGRGPGEITEYTFNRPEWDRIGAEYLNDGPYEYGHRRQGITPMNQLGQTLRQNRDSPAFEQALHDNYNPNDPTHVQNYNAYQQEKEPWYHPYSGEYQEGYSDRPPIHEYQKPLFEPNTDYNRWVADEKRQGDDFTQPINPEFNDWWQRGWQHSMPTDFEGTLPYGPYPDPKLHKPEPYVYAATTEPLYYRWIFSPSKGVTLGTNQDNHPALVKYHQALGGDINDTDLSHGYASPIGNGWRVSDLDHQPVGDPYIVQQVVRRLNAEDGSEIRSEGSWRPLEYDWDRLHYGLPREKVGSF